jgi:chaperonin GroES
MITLAGSKIAVRPIFDPDRTPGGLYIPTQAQERADQGIVKYVGPDVVDVRVGDYVLFSGYAGTLVILEGEGRFIILPEEFIICTVIRDSFFEVPGLFFKEANGEYFPATYEEAINLCADAVTEKRITLQVKSEKPRKEDYERLK